MSSSSFRLPQLDGGWYLTDGGIETVLIYQDGVDLPEFAAFVLMETTGGQDTLRRYYRRYLDIAAAASGAGFILESPTWRAGIDWGAKLGFDAEAMQRINAAAVVLMKDLRTEYASRIAGPIVISGCIGPRGDGYVAGAPMDPEDARRAHQPQADALAGAGVDQITAITMTSSAEAMGVARAAARAGRASAISFTVETDGTLPSGELLGAAIQAVDADAAASGHAAPAYYMINCAHPTHFEAAVSHAAPWRERIHGLRANASTLSHAELDAMTQLDSGNPQELADGYRRLRTPLPRLNVLGGCCGTDHRHVAAMCEAWLVAGSNSQPSPTKNRTTVERKSERELVVTRTIHAPPRIVFEAWTRAELFQRWWIPKSLGMTLLSCELDVRVGGGYRLVFPASPEPMAFHGRYLEVVVPSRLVWTNEEAGGNGQVTTVTFEESADKTLLVMHDLYPSKQALEEGAGGTDAIDETFNQLDELVASASLS